MVYNHIVNLVLKIKEYKLLRKTSNKNYKLEKYIQKNKNKNI